MSLYGGIDLHANNSVVVLLNDQDQVIYEKRLPNHLPAILGSDIQVMLVGNSGSATH